MTRHSRTTEALIFEIAGMLAVLVLAGMYSACSEKTALSTMSVAVPTAAWDANVSAGVTPQRDRDFKRVFEGGAAGKDPLNRRAAYSHQAESTQRTGGGRRTISDGRSAMESPAGIKPGRHLQTLSRMTRALSTVSIRGERSPVLDRASLTAPGAVDRARVMRHVPGPGAGISRVLPGPGPHAEGL